MIDAPMICLLFDITCGFLVWWYYFKETVFSCFYDNDLPLGEREAESIATRRAYLDTLGRTQRETDRL